MLLEKELSQKVKVSDSEIKKYYKKNMGELASPEEIRLSHIMAKSEAAIKRPMRGLKTARTLQRWQRAVRRQAECGAGRRYWLLRVWQNAA